MCRFVRSLSLLLAVCFLAAVGFSHAARIVTSKAPLYFEPNQGQAPASVRYVLRGGRVEAQLSPRGVALALPGPKKRFSVLHIRFSGANPRPSLTALHRLPGHSNYLIGNNRSRWIRNLPNYAQVRYQGIYPGISVLFYGHGRRLEHDFEIAPGADPSRIALSLTGAQPIDLAPDGDVRIHLPGGVLYLKKPVAYQQSAGKRIPVRASFVLAKDGTVRFHVGAYDRARELVIDPVLVYSTYLDSLPSQPNAIATDAAGDTYVVGTLIDCPFPTTPGAFQTVCSNKNGNELDYVVFITKLNAQGTAQIYSTLLGDNGSVSPTAISVDPSGNVVITGGTGGTNFPLRNPFMPESGNGGGTFVTSLTADGSALNYSTVFSTGWGGIYPATDTKGSTYIVGTEPYAGYNANFPATGGALNVPGGDIFVSKISPSGSLVYNAIVGSDGATDGQSTGQHPIVADSQGSVYISGVAGPGWNTTPNAYLSTVPAGANGSTPGYAYVSKLSPDGSHLEASTYVGAGSVDGLALDKNGNAWIVGEPSDTSYPTTANAYNASKDGATGFFSEISADGTKLLYSSYLPNNLIMPVSFTNYEAGITVSDIALDADGNVWITGKTNDPELPLVNPLVSFGQAGIVAEFDPTGTKLTFETLFGDTVTAIATDPAGNAHITGWTKGNLYTSPNSFLPGMQYANADYGGEYSYAAVINPGVAAPALCMNMPSGVDEDFYETLQATPLEITNCGNAPLTFQSIKTSEPAFSLSSNSCTGTLSAGASCSLILNFDNTGGPSCNATLVIQSNASFPTLVPLTLNIKTACLEEGSAANLSTDALSFPSQAVATTSAPQTVTLTNPGSLPLQIISIFSNSSEFAESNTCGTTVQPFGSCNISASFSPQADGTRVGGIAVEDSAGDSPQAIALSGTGTGPAPTVTLSAPILVFPLNATTSQTLTLTNSGAGPLSISSIKLPPAGDDASFSQTNTCPAILAGGAKCSIDVTFASTSTALPGQGYDGGNLTITDNAADSPQTVVLAGGTGGALLSASPASLTVASSGATATSTIEVTPYNGWTGQITLSCSIEWSGVGPAGAMPGCSVAPQTFTVTSKGGSTTLYVTTQLYSADSRPADPLGRSGAVLAFAVCLLWIPRRRWRGLLLMVLLLVVITGGISACGGGSANSGSGGGTSGSGGGSSAQGAQPGKYLVSISDAQYAPGNGPSVVVPVTVQ